MLLFFAIVKSAEIFENIFYEELSFPFNSQEDKIDPILNDIPPLKQFPSLDYKNFLLQFLMYSMDTYSSDTSLKNEILKFGYQKDGLRAKVYEDDSKLIVAFKGTTLSLYGIYLGETARRDKMNDTLMYSCCSEMTKQDNDLKSGMNLCLLKQVKESMKEDGYYYEGIDFLETIMKLYPNKEIVLTGHSMGGSMASLLALRFNLYAISFSSPGVKRIAEDLDLVPNTKDSKIISLGMCNDPIFMGRCEDGYSLCRLSGYKLQTKCHVGSTFCVDNGRSDSALDHRLTNIISYLKTNETVKINHLPEENCIECQEWIFA